MFMRVGWLMLAGASVAMAQEAAVKVSPAEISEKRSTILIKKENFFTSDHDALTLKLHIDGVAGATKYGKMKIDAASDDVGTALKPEKNPFHSGDDFADISRFGRHEEKTDAGFDVDLLLSLPPRKASKLVDVKGSLQVLSGGTEKVVKLSKLSSLVGKPVADPALKALGLTMTVTKVDVAKREIHVDYAGPMDAMQEVAIVDASGNKIGNGSMTMNFAGKMSTTYDVSKAIDDGTVMELHVMVGQKNVKVPFDLKDIKLP